MAVAKEKKQISQPDRIGLTPEGLFSPDKFQGFLSPEVAAMKPEEFLQWVEAGAKEPGELTADDIVTFRRGKDVPFVTDELEIPGVLLPAVNGAVIKVGVPYAVRVVKEVYPEIPSSHAYLLEALKEVDSSDYLEVVEGKYRPWLSNPYRRVGATFISQLNFEKGEVWSKHKVIGFIAKGERKAVVPGSQARPRPVPGETWIARIRTVERIIEPDGKVILSLVAERLYTKVVTWNQFEVATKDGKPVVAVRRYKGIKKLYSRVLRFSEPRDLNKLQRLQEELKEDLSDREGAIFAQLWNIYWQREREGVEGDWDG